MLLVEKRVAGIIRWLERLKKSYSSGALESALMDAECARADLENLRLAVWEKVKPSKPSEPKIFTRIINFLKPVILAVVIVLFHVFPIAKDINAPVPQIIEIVENVEISEAVTEQVLPEEKHIAVSLPKKSTAKKSSTQTKRALNTKPAKEAQNPQTTKSVAYDKVFSLMQTGQRALKNNNSVVKIK